MKKPVKPTVAASSGAAPIDDLIEEFPALAEQLTSTAYDGDPPGSRQTSTLLVFAQDGCFKAVLRDRQEARALWVATPSLLDVYSVMEAALNDPAAVWRDDRVSGAPEAKRQKPGK